jgi:radical SAM protein with 4Fe4S-binding SPASM domain
MENRYFYFKEKVKIVYGAKGAAIYDLSSGDVFAIEEAGVPVLKAIEKTSSIEQSVLFEDFDVSDFLNQMESANLGFFIEKKLNLTQEKHVFKARVSLDVLWLEITNKCNFKCVHCYFKQDKTENQFDLDLKDWKKVLIQASEIGCKKVVFIGGEPLMKKELLKNLVEFSKELTGIEELEIFTNGYFLDPDLIKYFGKLGVKFAVSFYSLESKIHESVTKKKGSFNFTLNFLKFLKLNNICFRISIIAMKNNEDSIDDTMDWLENIFPGTEIGYDVVRPIGNGCVDLQPFREFPGQIRREASFPKVTEKDFLKRHFGHNCLFGKLVVGSNGVVRPCVMSSLILGDVKKNSLAQIINFKCTRKLWLFNKNEIPECSVCEFKYACMDCPPKTCYYTSTYYSKPYGCMYDPYTGIWNKERR